MANSFLQRLFGRKKSGSDTGSLSLTETMKSVARPGTPRSDVAVQKDMKPLESRAKYQTHEKD